MSYLMRIREFIYDMIGGPLSAVDGWLNRHYRKVIGVLLIIIFLVVTFGCSTIPSSRVERTAGGGYNYWENAPDWVAADFVKADWGLLDGMQFIGEQGQMCYVIKIDMPPTDGECDTISVVCESGAFDNRHGPDTPLVIGVGRAPCDSWDDIKVAVDNLKKDL